jgi:hypothetical protein
MRAGSEVVRVAAGLEGRVVDQRSNESGCAEVKSVINGVQSARLEELTRLARASRVKVRANERKKDSDRAALEEE